MKYLWVGLWFLLQVTSLWSVDITTGQAQVGSVVGTVTDNNVTANLITSPLSPVVSATAPAGFSGGNQVGYNATTNTYYFGYAQQTIAKTIAINNALQGSGVQINGVQYGMSYLNGGNSYGTLGMNVNVTSNTGTVLNSYSHSFNTQNPAWQQFDQTQTFTNPYEIANLGNVSMSITGKDSRFWAGYYGPQVRDPYLKLTYGADPKTYYNIPDDGYVPVSLPFTFPFYGRNFIQSYMFSNGVVGFLDPTTHWNGFCCDGVNLQNNPGTPWNFAIYALQTDLIQANANAKFYTQTNGSSYMKYAWENVNEYGTQNLNTFSTTIKPTGYIGIQHDSINVQNHSVTTGIAGDISAGQYSQYYTGTGSMFPYTVGSVITFTGTESNACVTNPLSSPSCPGYTDAQCQINPLYSQVCPGYQTAYFSQQCTNNQLYNQACPGYASAYLAQQCSINPLYSTTCDGYETAYFNQQCSLNPLYSNRCVGYATAYHDQQCSINPLYATDCIGYAQAYFNQQCSLNGLYDRTCPNYSEAYATKMLLEQQNLASTVATAGVVASTAPVSTTTATTSESVTTQLSSGISDTTVSSVVTTKSTATNTDTQPAAAVKLTAPQAPATSPTNPQQMAQNEPKKDGPKDEKKEEGNKQNGPGNQPNGPSDSNKPSDQPKSNREALQERRAEAAKKEAVARGKDLANEMGKASDMEAQKAVQNVVIQAMGFTPGFDTYNKAMVPDARFYAPKIVYGGQVNVDNKNISRRLMSGSDKLHQDMVEEQYNRGN